MIFRIKTFESLPSTNTYLKEHVGQYEEGQVIVAKKQNSGRGRRGKDFSSPKSGLYFSVLLCPKDTTEALRLPLLAGIAVSQGISSLTGFPVLLKWPNDCLMNGKKIVGILGELTPCGRAVLGIGINMTTSRSYFDGLKLFHVSSILEQTGKHIDHMALLDVILTNLDVLFNMPAEQVMNLYRSLSLMLGKTVTTSNGITGVIQDINEKGELLMQTSDQKTIVLSSGEVSILGIY